MEMESASKMRKKKAIKRASLAPLWVCCILSTFCLVPTSLAQQPPAPSAVVDTESEHGINGETETDTMDSQERSLSWLFPGRAPTATHIELKTHMTEKKMYTKWKQKWKMKNSEHMYTKWKKKFHLWSNPAPPEPLSDDYYYDSQDDYQDDQDSQYSSFSYGGMYSKGYAAAKGNVLAEGYGGAKGNAGANGNGGNMYWSHHYGQMKWHPPPRRKWRGKWNKEKYGPPQHKPPSFFPMFSPPRPPVPRPPFPPPFPTPTPPFPSPVPPFPSPPPQTFLVDFSTASLLNPSVYLAVAQVGTQIIVDLTLPLQQGQTVQVYLVENRDVGMGSVCPPAGGLNILIAPGQTFVSVGLTNNDSIVAVCVDNVVVGLSYFPFETSVSINGGIGHPYAPFPDSFTEVADFSDVSVANPLLYSIEFGPGVGRADPGTLIMYGSRAAGPPRRQLFVDAFYASPRGQQVVVGSTCPLPGDQILAPDELFPLTLYQVRGTADQLIFACNFGVVVGIVNLHYVANSGPFYRRLEVDCLGGGGRGYDSLASLNEDIIFERNRVLAGGVAEPAYHFTLCPNSPVDANVPLRPALDNIFISCGQSPGPQSTCALVGGTTQVQVETHAASLFPVGSITLTFVTFTGFSYAAIAGVNVANDMTTIIVQDSVFSSNAEQGFLIDQSTLVGRPFSVVVQDCTVEDVNLATGFANDGGTLTIDSLTISTSNIACALVAVNGISGVLTISGLSVFECVLADVILVLDGATSDIYQIRVSAMTGMGRIIDIAGLGTTVSVREAKILDNVFTRNGEDWIGIRVLDSASLTISDSRFSNNAGSEAMFLAGRGGQLTMERVDVVNSIGALSINNSLFPAVIKADNGVVFHRDSLIQGISSYTAVYFSIHLGSIDINRVCINGNQADAAIFISTDSIYQVAGNAIENVDTTVCPNSAVSGPPGPNLGRLVKERLGSSCFSPPVGGICEVDCAPFAQYASCAEIPGFATRTTETSGNDSSETTHSPSLAPSFSPTAVPSSLPSSFPSSPPSDEPSGFPSALPSLSSAQIPGSSKQPTIEPSVSPSISNQPSADDFTEEPTSAPSASPTTTKPTVDDSTTEPTSEPTSAPSVSPTTMKPTVDDSTKEPTLVAACAPSASPTIMSPTVDDSTKEPSSSPTTIKPTVNGSTKEPTLLPTSKPSLSPSTNPTAGPTQEPSSSPSTEPTAIPSLLPSKWTPAPSGHPSEFPSLFPSQFPSESPSEASTSVE